MASSNRHWPSLFKSKSCTSHHQWHHDINSSLMSAGGCNKAPCTSVPAICEERSPEPKQRWNPRPEQIRILEAIFNSGMVNPPRDEIRKIRIKLQEFGQVGDANVFYWFQNRKSRSKHKQQRHLQTNNKTPSSSSSSNSVGSTTNNNNNVIDLLNSPTASVNQFQQTYFGTNNDFNMAAEPFIFTQGFLHDVATDPHSCDVVHNSSGLFLSELMGISQTAPLKKAENEKMDYIVPSAPNTTNHSTVVPLTTSSTTPNISHIQGVEGSAGGCPTKAMIFINDVAFEVPAGPFNVSEVFGDDALLIHSSGQPLLTNEWGVSIQPLQHGAFYYLVHTSTPVHDNTIALM
uniref:Protein WUSCHEL n=5 Tax=Petunia TaxID=4101 RepID=A9XDF7_PETHY|nr:EVERGREEN [Petunia x hybrida]